MGNVSQPELGAILKLGHGEAASGKLKLQKRDIAGESLYESILK
jgi:hypothetical protein